MAQPKQTDPQFKLRLPAELKAQIEEAAKSSNRTLNAEMIHRLERSFNPTTISLPETLFEPVRVKAAFNGHSVQREVVEALRPLYPLPTITALDVLTFFEEMLERESKSDGAKNLREKVEALRRMIESGEVSKDHAVKFEPKPKKNAQ